MDGLPFSPAPQSDPHRSDQARIAFDDRPSSGVIIQTTYLLAWLGVILVGRRFVEPAVAAALILLCRPIRRVFVHRTGSSNDGDGGVGSTVKVEVVINSAGCHVTWPPRSWTSSWDDMKGWSENDQWLLLHLSTAAVIRVPVSAVGGEFRTVLDRYGAQKKRAHTRMPGTGFPKVVMIGAGLLVGAALMVTLIAFAAMVTGP